MTYPLGVPGLTPVMIFILILWVLPWKGVALWKAARKNNLWWFIVLLVINTVGVLEILYIFVFSERKGIKSAK
jgi:hypothetical protein